MDGESERLRWNKTRKGVNMTRKQRLLPYAQDKHPQLEVIGAFRYHNFVSMVRIYFPRNRASILSILPLRSP